MRSKQTVLAVLGVALLVVAAGCGGTGPANNGNNSTQSSTSSMTSSSNVTSTSNMTSTSGSNVTSTSNMTSTSSLNATSTSTSGGGMQQNQTRNQTRDRAGNVTFEDQQSNGSTVVVSSAGLPQGGFVVIHAVENGSAGRVLGHTAYLSPGQHANVSVSLDSPLNQSAPLIAMTHMDTNGNQQYDFPGADGPYTTSDGSPVTARANVTVT